MKPNFSKEQMEYGFVVEHLELRDGVIWVKEYVDKIGKVRETRPAKGRVNDDGYLRIWVGGKHLFEHRIIFILTYNRPIREGYEIHHDNNNPSDNRIENLKEVSHQENCQNKQIHLDGKPVNVGFNKESGKWMVRIRVNGKRYFLGYYETPEDGNKVYLLAEQEVNEHGHLVRSRAERATAAGVIPCTRRKRLRNSESRGERTQLEYDNIRTDSK